MILDGSTSKDIALIYDKAKVARRELIREGQVPVHAKTLQTILSAATIPSKGTLSVRKFVEKQFPKVSRCVWCVRECVRLTLCRRWRSDCSTCTNITLVLSRSLLR